MGVVSKKMLGSVIAAVLVVSLASVRCQSQDQQQQFIQQLFNQGFTEDQIRGFLRQQSQQRQPVAPQPPVQQQQPQQPQQEALPPRTKVFFDVAADGVPLGQIRMELF